MKTSSRCVQHSHPADNLPELSCKLRRLRLSFRDVPARSPAAASAALPPEPPVRNRPMRSAPSQRSYSCRKKGRWTHVKVGDIDLRVLREVVVLLRVANALCESARASSAGQLRNGQSARQRRIPTQFCSPRKRYLYTSRRFFLGTSIFAYEGLRDLFTEVSTPTGALSAGNHTRVSGTCGKFTQALQAHLLLPLSTCRPARERPRPRAGRP